MKPSGCPSPGDGSLKLPRSVQAGRILDKGVFEYVGRFSGGVRFSTSSLAKGAPSLAFEPSRSLVLDHPTRQRIYDHLLLLPGDHFRSIVRSLRLAHGSASHHLAVLVRRELVGIDKTNGRARYFPKGAGSESERNQLFLKHWVYRDLRLRILQLARTKGPVKGSTVASSLGISRQLAAYHLARLEELGHVRRENGHYRV